MKFDATLAIATHPIQQETSLTEHNPETSESTENPFANYLVDANKKNQNNEDDTINKIVPEQNEVANTSLAINSLDFLPDQSNLDPSLHNDITTLIDFSFFNTVEIAEMTRQQQTNDALSSEKNLNVTQDNSASFKLNELNLQTTELNSSENLVNAQPILMNINELQPELPPATRDPKISFQAKINNFNDQTKEQIQQKYASALGFIQQAVDTNYSSFAENLKLSPRTINHPVANDIEIKIEMLPMNQDTILRETYHAKIKIYPPELGQVVAKLKVSEQGASLSLVADNQKVKEIIEANMGKLMANFHDAHIPLTQVAVTIAEENSFNSYTKNPDAKHSDSHANHDQSSTQDFDHAETNQKSQKISKLNSLVDTFA